MESAENKRFVYEFGRFVLDPQEKKLLVDGVPIHLPAKEFETLLLLIENNGRALSKDEMMSAVWRDAFVEEGNLAKQVSKLRKLLKGDGDATIETIPKLGYRFSSDVRLVESEDRSPVIAERKTVRRVKMEFGDEDEAPTSRSLPPAHRGLQSLALPAVLLIAVLLVGGFLWTGYRTDSPTPTEIRSIAVLPLQPLTADENMDRLGLGLADSLITELGSLRHLVVRPIGAVRGFVNSGEGALDLGRKLHVDAVLDGTVQEAGGRIRINARLIRTSNGEQIWAEKFDDNLTNVFEVQDRISEQAARALTAMLTDQRGTIPSGGRLTKRYTQNPVAFDAYLKGRYHWNKRTDADFRQAIGYFEQAVQSDPEYSLAYVGLADSHILRAVWGTEPPSSSMELAKQAALKALSADPDLSEAHTSFAFIKWVYDWDFLGADAEFARAVELNPNYATAQHWRAYYLVSVGRGDDAITAIKRAQELEGPLSVGIMTDVGEIHCWAGKYDEAITHLLEVIRLEPNYAVAHYELGIAYLQKNRTDEAIAELERARELENAPRVTSALAYAYGTAGRNDHARTLILELEELSRKQYVSPFSIAVAYAGIGDKDRTMDRLQMARAERSDAMGILKVHPLLLSMHSDPRFVRLAKEVGYPE